MESLVLFKNKKVEYIKQLNFPSVSCSVRRFLIFIWGPSDTRCFVLGLWEKDELNARDGSLTKTKDILLNALNMTYTMLLS